MKNGTKKIHYEAVEHTFFKERNPSGYSKIFSLHISFSVLFRLQLLLRYFLYSITLKRARFKLQIFCAIKLACFHASSINNKKRSKIWRKVGSLNREKASRQIFETSRKTKIRDLQRISHVTVFFRIVSCSATEVDATYVEMIPHYNRKMWILTQLTVFRWYQCFFLMCGRPHVCCCFSLRSWTRSKKRLLGLLSDFPCSRQVARLRKKNSHIREGEMSGMRKGIKTKRWETGSFSFYFWIDPAQVVDPTVV